MQYPAGYSRGLQKAAFSLVIPANTGQARSKQVVSQRRPEDHLRNKRGKGVRGEYDDSIDSDAADPDPVEDSMQSSEDAPTPRPAR